MQPAYSRHLTIRVVTALIAGIIVGLGIKALPAHTFIDVYLVDHGFHIIGQMFIEAMKMLVVPVVFVSLVCGTLRIGGGKALGRVGLKTLALYLSTTLIAVTAGLIAAKLFSIGSHARLDAEMVSLNLPAPASLQSFLIRLIPANPVAAMSEGNMLQIIIFALLIGMAISLSKRKAEPLVRLFQSANHVLMRLIHLIMAIAPIGIFCLLVDIFAKTGFNMILSLLSYFATVALVLTLHGAVVYSIFLIILARINPLRFFSKLYALMVFAFSTSSSSASLPVTLETVEEKLGIDNRVAAFVIPMGATMNMDGTAIMQGIATVFIANLYQIHLGLSAFIGIMLTATLASVGTAGVPGVGMITLALVLKQAGLPVEAIGLIIGVDRLLDMLRTVINVTGDCMVAFIVGKSEGALDTATFHGKHPES